MSFTSMRCPICLRDAPSIGCPVVAQWVDEERMSFLTSHVAKGEPDALADMAGFWSSAVKHAYEEAGGLSLDPSVLARTTLSWHGTTSPGGDKFQCTSDKGAGIYTIKLRIGPVVALRTSSRGVRGVCPQVCDGTDVSTVTVATSI
ncbi:unnamed protein product [Choristocarpus tenellus]